jgi:hypothetical protein
MLDAEKLRLALQAKEANLNRYVEPLREENAAVLRDLGVSILRSILLRYGNEGQRIHVHASQLPKEKPRLG